MKQILLILGLAMIVTSRSGATSVSGGIFTNTTWTKAASPYIVTDTVVVFPGVTLTIEPGVTVKFVKDKRLEIRYAQLVAVGTASDPIVFTSNAISPAKGDWSGVFVIHGGIPGRTHQFDHCVFMYAHFGIESRYTSTGGDTFRVKNSLFQFNNSGMCGESLIYMPRVFIDSSDFSNNDCGIGSFEGNPNGTRVWATIRNSNFSNNRDAGAVIGYGNLYNSTFNNNQTGIWNNDGNNTIVACTIDSNSVQGILLGPWYDSIANCSIRFNGIGITGPNYGGANIITRNIIADNTVGIQLKFGQDSIYCNAICRNTTYAIKHTGTANISKMIHNNNFCTPDSASTEAVIYHAYDNPGLGILQFMPIDTVCPPAVPVVAVLAVSAIAQQQAQIYPNPFSRETTIEWATPLHEVSLTVSNVVGQVMKEVSHISGQRFVLPRGDMQAGVYFVQIRQGGKILATKRALVVD